MSEQPALSDRVSGPGTGFVGSRLNDSASSSLFPVQSQASALRLGGWQEAIGVLRSVDRISGVIAFQNLRITVPPRELEALLDLESFIGSRVGILRTDLSHKPLLLRRADIPTQDQPSTQEEPNP